MIRYVTRNARILFVGINPHPGSYRREVPFSNNKLFWYLLSRAGLIKETEEELRDDAKLRRMYKEKFNQTYGLGFINLIDRPTRDITKIRKGEELPGRERIFHIIMSEKPEIACFIGKVSYEKYAGSKHFTFGWQKNTIGVSRVFVMHFPLRGEAIVRVRELRKIRRALE